MTKIKEETVSEDVRIHVRERYGQIAETFQPESEASCCGPGAQSGASDCCGPADTIALDKVARLYEADDVNELPEEVTGLSLGCGDPVTLATLNRGETVLDLGSGGGIDCFLAAKRVGESGRVIGVDMTPAMLERARANKAKLGIPNVEFRLGEIEHIPVADETVDVVISNCVINLSPDKQQVFREAFRVLKPGGRLSVSDIVTDGPLPEAIKENLDAWAGCVVGALEQKDYIASIEAAGFEAVSLTPVSFDRETIDETVEEFDLGEAIEGLDDERIYRSVFSAKVTARKPI